MSRVQWLLSPDAALQAMWARKLLGMSRPKLKKLVTLIILKALGVTTVTENAILIFDSFRKNSLNISTDCMQEDEDPPPTLLLKAIDPHAKSHFHERIKCVLSLVLAGYEKSVNNIADNHHFKLELKHLCVLKPLLQEYLDGIGNSNVGNYKTANYQTFWGTDPKKLQRGSWRLKPEYRPDTGVSPGAPALYIACIHLYYAVFQGELTVPSRRVHPNLPIPMSATWLPNYRRLQTWICTTYFTPDNNLDVLVQPYVDPVSVLRWAQSVDDSWRRQETSSVMHIPTTTEWTINDISEQVTGEIETRITQFNNNGERCAYTPQRGGTPPSCRHTLIPNERTVMCDKAAGGSIKFWVENMRGLPFFASLTTADRATCEALFDNEIDLVSHYIKTMLPKVANEERTDFWVRNWLVYRGVATTDENVFLWDLGACVVMTSRETAEFELENIYNVVDPTTTKSHVTPLAHDVIMAIVSREGSEFTVFDTADNPNHVQWLFSVQSNTVTPTAYPSPPKTLGLPLLHYNQKMPTKTPLCEQYVRTALSIPNTAGTINTKHVGYEPNKSRLAIQTYAPQTMDRIITMIKDQFWDQYIPTDKDQGGGKRGGE